MSSLYKPKYFNLQKEKILCPCCGTRPQDVLLRFMDRVREYVGRPVRANSVMRCESYNASIPKSAKSSRHIRGIACDFHAPTLDQRIEIFEACVACGARRVGWYRWGIHADLDNTGQRKLVIWRG